MPRPFPRPSACTAIQYRSKLAFVQAMGPKQAYPTVRPASSVKTNEYPLAAPFARRSSTSSTAVATSSA